jgi:hypothetical protein
VLTVTVDVFAPVAIVTAGAAHVAGLAAAVGVTVQVRFTRPVNPFDGVTVIVAVSPVVAPATNVIGPLFVSVIAGVGGAVTVTLTPVLEVSLPVATSVPVTVAV